MLVLGATLALAAVRGAADAPVHDLLRGGGDADIRAPAEVFVPFPPTFAGDALLIDWHIEPGHYLYRDAFRFTLETTPDLALGEPRFSVPTVIVDPHFGETAVFRDTLRIELPVGGALPRGTVRGIVRIDYQGCVEGRLCYPPATTELAIIGEIESDSGP